MAAKLRAPLPAEATKAHPTKTFLTTIKAIYVTERLNQVFGIGAWRTEVEHVLTTDKSMVVVKVKFTIPEFGIYYECFGGNDNGGENSKNFDLGDAFKGATTDAITKIGSWMEIGIDIFKGKVTGEKKELPWMSESQYKSVLERAAKGEENLIAKIEASLQMRKEYRAGITAAIKNYKKPEFDPNVMNVVIKAMGEAKTLKDLTEMFNKNSEYHTQKIFVDTYAKLQKQLAIPA